MARLNKKPEDRKKEIEQVRKEEEKTETKFGHELKPKFGGAVEKFPLRK